MLATVRGFSLSDQAQKAVVGNVFSHFKDPTRRYENRKIGLRYAQQQRNAAWSPLPAFQAKARL